MVTTFCLRLALGMLAPMTLLPAAIVPPRFFRVQFLSALALLVLAWVFSPAITTLAAVMFVVAGLVCLAGSIVWHTDEAIFGRALMWGGTIAVAAILVISNLKFEISDLRFATAEAGGNSGWILVDDFASALMLGAAVSAMLMGHSYLIAPAMSLSPLNRLLGLLAAALTIRIGLACVGLYLWTRQIAPFDFETGLWLAARWLLGLLFPVALTWMAWETARIRSTQSATGILYVVTILVFLGELLSLLLAGKTGMVM